MLRFNLPKIFLPKKIYIKIEIQTDFDHQWSKLMPEMHHNKQAALFIKEENVPCYYLN